MIKRNEIHPTAVVESSVSLGSGNTIGPYAVILGNVLIGDDNWIGPHAVIGTPAEHREFHLPGQPPLVPKGGIRIESRCVVHEHVAIQSPTIGDTLVGSESFLMHGVHVAHDVEVGEGVTIAPYAVLGGHVVVGSKATIGMGAVVHQRLHVGPLSMVGMQASVTKDVAPFAVVAGNPARFVKVNSIALEKFRTGFGKMSEHLSGSVDSWDISLLPAELQEIVVSYQRKLLGQEL
jgi:UDP-N-acetylglucosamine acyltransferase